MNPAWLLVLALIGAMLLAIRLKREAFARLHADEKARLVAGFSSQRKYMWILVVLGLVALQASWVALPIGGVGVAVLAAAVFGHNILKMRRLGVSPAYVRTWAAGQVVQLVALIAFVAALFRATPLVR